jgi:thioredoxin reductase (NADPH)
MQTPERFDVIVVGGGVAGLTAALFAARLGRSTLVLIPLMAGGQLATIHAIEDFPGFPQGVAGFDLGPIIQEQAVAAGAEIRMDEAQRLDRLDDGWRVVTTEDAIDARALIVATGSRIRALEIPGEARLAGKGVSHCASCDGPLLRGKSVIVAGAGDSGLQEALALADFAAKVLILERLPQPTGQQAYARRTSAHPRIEFRGGVVIEEVLGENAVTGVRARDAASGESRVLAADALFVYAGLRPNTALVAGLLELDRDGRIPTDGALRTALPGVFAAGDVRGESACQAVSAAGDGATAAVSAHRYLG